MAITFVGTGYVGLVTGACMGKIGNHLFCLDVNTARIEALQRNKLPIYEPGLESLASNNQTQNRLMFTADLGQSLSNNDIIFVTVGTPQRENGSANLDYVWSIVDAICETATESKLVVIKSTAAVGTSARVETLQ